MTRTKKELLDAINELGNHAEEIKRLKHAIAYYVHHEDDDAITETIDELYNVKSYFCKDFYTIQEATDNVY